MGRRVRRVGRSISRVGRRVSREISRGARRVRDVAEDTLGGLPVIGQIGGALGLETPEMKQQKALEEQERNRQAELDRQERNRQLEEQWAREQQKIAQSIMNTQTRVTPQDDDVNLSTLLLDEEEVNKDKDLLKRMLKRK